MKPLHDYINTESNTSWGNCHIDIWFVIAKYLRPEDTTTFSLICKKTAAVTESEVFWKNMFDRYIRSKYPWLDRPTESDGLSKQVLKFLFVKFMNLFRFKVFAIKQFGSFSRVINHLSTEKLILIVTTK